MMKRQFAAIDQCGQVVVKEEELPPLEDNEILLKVHASLISPGTEMELIKAKRRNPDTRTHYTPFGYANAGEIIDVKGDVKSLTKGMRVAAMGAGYAIHGNYACVPVNMAVPIPEQVTFAQAAYACLGATGLHAVRRTEPRLGEYGIVLGLGIVGNLTAQLCQLSGGRIMAWENMASRREIGDACGIHNCIDPQSENSIEATRDFAAPYGADFAVLAFGGKADEALQQVIKCMKEAPDTHKMGRVVLVGAARFTVVGGAVLGNMDLRAAGRTGPGYHDKAYERGADYPDAFIDFTTQRNLREIVQLIAEKRLLVDPMTTHVMPLAEVREATDLLINHPDRALGIVLIMEH